MSAQAQAFPVQSMQEYERGFYTAYSYVNGMASYDKSVLRLSRLGSKSLTMLGEVHLQEAAWNPDSASDLLDQAADTLEQRVYSDELGFDPRAAIRLAQIPLHRSILIADSFPTNDEVAETYQQVLWAATTAAEHFKYRDSRHAVENMQLLGTLSEAAILLLASRFALQHRLTGDWLPLQSLLAEDMRTADKSTGWDVSVHLPDADSRPQVGYKVQVKSSNKHVTTYSRDISVIAINPDLEIQDDVRAKSVDIITDLQREASPFQSSKRATVRLNARTAHLLRIMERAK